MYNSISLDNALSVPYPDIVALSQGRMITIITHMDMYFGRSFALYPVNTLLNLFSVDEYYKSSFLSTCKTVLDEINSDKVELKFWGKCHNCSQVNDPEDLTKLSKVTLWTEEGLKTLLKQRGNFFLTYLRVYKLPEPIAMSPLTNARFVPLPHSITVTEANPILDDNKFEHLYRKILNRQPPEHPELEELETAIAPLTLTHPDAKFLKDKIQTFLGWQPAKPPEIPENLNWINTINELGTTSEGGKYEKGTAFENIVHQSLTFLGFELDQNAKGGAGGMDLYCTKPYPMVGECKAGKSLPDSTAEQLYRIGVRHLGKGTYEKAVKLIIGPGQPTSYLEKSAQNAIISIINPMTLEKLVKLQAQYPGSVNLFELKNYLQAGQIDDKIDEYIETVINRLKLRSHIIKVVKDYLNNAQMTEATVSGIHGIYCYNPPQPLSQKQLHEILIELSSPLAGYLGRKTAEEWHNDRFYYLRELIVDQS